MVKLAIRDDDLNFFTKVDDLEKVYGPISYFPISYAVIPTVMDVSTVGKCPETRGNSMPMWIGENHDICNWLKEKLRRNECDILMHGITHSYHFVNGNRKAEMEWRNEQNLCQEIKELKTKMEMLFDYKISVFVAPSNKISSYGIQCVSANDMNFSGIIPIGFRREFTITNILSYLKRWWCRAVYDLPYPNILYYTTHKELNACTLQGYDYLVKMYHYCERINSPMVVNVHYWHLRDNEQERCELIRFINYAMEHGAVPSRMSEVLK